MLTASVTLFGVVFLCNDRYEKTGGSGSAAAFFFMFVSNAAGLSVMLIVNRFHISATAFTLWMGVAAALDSALYTVCSLKALGRINLSLYAVFAMLGGMLLPLLTGILFYREPMTLAIGICVLLIIAALALTVKKDGRRGGFIWYAGVFVFNGLAGVLSKIFTEAPFPKTDAASYSIWAAAFTALIGGIGLLIVFRSLSRPGIAALLWSAGGGAVSRVANYWLVLALLVLPASVQYPFVTGGTMIVSTLLAFAVGQRPSKRELLAVGLSFLGILALVLIKI